MNGGMRLNEGGRLVQAALDDLTNHYPNVELDEFVVMPNDVHAIAGVTVGVGFKPLQLPNMGCLKSCLH